MSNPFDRNKTVEAKLGQIITEPGAQNQRDAVHIAVVPVVASTRLARAQLCGVTPCGTKSVVGNGNPVGIVDPFLVFDVEPGQTFWLFLFQGSVHTLRHEWTHPAFPSVAPQSSPLISDERKRLAEFRMRQLAEDQCGWTLANLLEHAKDAVEGEGHIFMGDTEGVTAYPEFLEDIGILTGVNVSGKEAPWFSCSC